MTAKSSSAQGNGIKALFALKSLDLSGDSKGRPLSAGSRAAASSGGPEESASPSVEQRLNIVRRGRGSRDGADALGLPAAPPVAHFPRFSAPGAPVESAIRAAMMEVVDATMFPDIISL